MRRTSCRQRPGFCACPSQDSLRRPQSVCLGSPGRHKTPLAHGGGRIVDISVGVGRAILPPDFQALLVAIPSAALQRYTATGQDTHPLPLPCASFLAPCGTYGARARCHTQSCTTSVPPVTY